MSTKIAQDFMTEANAEVMANHSLCIKNPELRSADVQSLNEGTLRLLIIGRDQDRRQSLAALLEDLTLLEFKSPLDSSASHLLIQSSADLRIKNAATPLIVTDSELLEVGIEFVEARPISKLTDADWNAVHATLFLMNVRQSFTLSEKKALHELAAHYPDALPPAFFVIDGWGEIEHSLLDPTSDSVTAAKDKLRLEIQTQLVPFVSKTDFKKRVFEVDSLNALRAITNSRKAKAPAVSGFPRLTRALKAFFDEGREEAERRRRRRMELWTAEKQRNESTLDHAVAQPFESAMPGSGSAPDNQAISADSESSPQPAAEATRVAKTSVPLNECADDAPKESPLDASEQRQNTTPPRFPKISHEAYAVDADQMALEKVKAIPIFPTVVEKIREYIDDQQQYLLYASSSVRCGINQFPTLHRLLREACATLDLLEPELYLVNDPTYNAMAVGVAKPFVVLHSGLVRDFTDVELRFVIGHELGHIHCRHLLYKQVVHFLPDLLSMAGSFIPGLGQLLKVGTMGLVMALYEWSRQAEFSCDRAGLLACGDVCAAQSALMKLSCGAMQSRFDKEMNLEAFVKQASDYENSDDVNSVARLLFMLKTAAVSHPHSVLRRPRHRSVG